MKRLICLFLAIAVLSALAAGCSVDIDNLGPSAEIPPASTISDEELSKVMSGYGAEKLDELDDEARKALEKELNDQGVLPSGVTLPAETSPTVTLPVTMPQGTKVQNSEAFTLVKGVMDTLGSDTYTLKTHGTSLMGSSSSSALSTSMTFAKSGNKSMSEMEVDWVAMMKAATEGTSDYNKAVISGSTMQTIFGKRIRSVTNENGAYMVFPDKKSYFDPKKLSEEVGETMDDDANFDMSSIFTDTIRQSGELKNANVTSSKVTMDGNEYLCGTLAGSEGAETRFYFLMKNKEFKRMEFESNGETVVLEIDEFSDKADSSLFSLSGYKEMALAQMLSMMEGLVGVFG